MAAASPRFSVVRSCLVVAALAGAGVVAWYVFVHDDPVGQRVQPAPLEYEPPPPDPRLTFATPFRNVRPDVQYLGDVACTACHFEIDKTYHAHPMGRSAAFVSKATPIERFDAAAHNPSTVGPYELLVDRSGDAVLHRMRAKDGTGMPLPDYVTRADLAIGSGTRGRSYLSLQQGAVWQTPISWYGYEARWDQSPGFDLGNGGRRGIVSDCLFCHVNRVDPVPESINRYRDPFPIGQAAIGCERCHGPGELHVSERSAGLEPEKMDTSIVNPKYLSAQLQAGICAQCHLQGEQRIARRGRNLSEFRPGLPLEQFITVFVRHPDLADLHRSVGQFEQMYTSRCFTESRGRLGCTSCHDPHQTPAPAGRDRFYSSRCLTCHAPGSMDCSESPAARRAKNDLCVVCHMPKPGSSNIAHTSVTDHRVPRRLASPTRPAGLRPGTIPVIPFPIGPHVPSITEQERDLGIALARLIPHVPADEANTRVAVASYAEERLTASVSRWREDLPAWLALCLARQTHGDLHGGLEAATTASELAPESDEARANLAACLAARNSFDAALKIATEWTRMNPTALEPLLLRVEIYLGQRDWQHAETDCLAALAIHPLHPRARLYLALCRHQLGDPAGGRKEADTAIGLTTKPHQRTAFLDWYRSQTR